MKIRSGQVALIVVLVVLVGLTVGVAVAGRSVTSLSIGSQEEERARSFSAAEAGIEDALRQDLSILAGSSGQFAVGNAAVSYTVTKLTNIVSEVNSGEVVTVNWSKSDPGASSFSVSWSGVSCGGVNLAATAVTPAGGITHRLETASPATFTKGAGGLVRLRFVGCQTTATISGQGGALSLYQVNSLGTSGEAKSKVQLSRSVSSPMGLMDFAVFSGGGID